ncbi:MAG: energy-coupling factor transporter transmembrane component T [Eubacteriales bacterium]|nr:energy-coupling factor transporter transmembrane component T [Eubacteriales bacterium]
MIRDITIGQYYNTKSPIHALDPRVKIWIAFVYVMSLFFDRNPLLYGIGFIALMIYILISHIPFRFILKGLKALWMIITFTAVINLFTVKGFDIVFQWRFIKITATGIQSAIYLGLRLVFMIIGSSMMTYTTTPTALTDGLEKMLGWMNRLRVPVHELAMIMAIALRFIPVLTEELDKIMKAQMARGVDFKEGNLIVRLKKMLPIVVPLFVSAIRRSNDLALAMDARCYHGGEGRTKMKPLRYRKQDLIAYGMLIVYVAGMIAVAIVF